MAVTITAADFAGAMKAAAQVVDTRNTIPILANVRLQADGDALEILTTNLDVEFRQRIPAQVDGGFATTVDARRLSGLAGAVDKGAQITLEPDGNTLSAKSGRSRWKLPTLPADDFPLLALDLPSPVTMPGAVLASAIRRTVWSVCTEPTRAYLAGIYLDSEGGKLRLTSTNGHTLASIVTDTDWPDDAVDAILPEKLMHTIQQAAETQESVSLAWHGSAARFTAGDIVITGKAIDGTFPDYRRVIPPHGDAPALLDPASLSGAIRRIELVATEKTRCIRIERAGSKLVASATDTVGGEAVEEVPADCAEGHATGVNAVYLRQMLDAIGGDTVELHQADAGSQILLRRTVADGAICVMMPMRI